MLFETRLHYHVVEFGTRAITSRVLLDSRWCLVGKRAGAARSSSLAFLAKTLDNSQHFLSAAVAIDHFTCHTHGYLFSSVGTEQALDQ